MRIKTYTMDTLDSQYLHLREADFITRTEFYKKTYAHVAGAVLAFIILETILISMPWAYNMALSFVSSGTTWLLVLGGFMFATSYAERMAQNTHSIKKQYIGLGIYVVAEAIIFLPLIIFAMAAGGGTTLIAQAGIMTLALFGGLTAVVFTTKKDFSFLKKGLMIGSFIAIGLIIAGTFIGFNLGLAFSAGMIILAAGSILYQTSNLIHKYHTDQHVAASLGLFASVMLLFWYILRIFLSRD